MIAANLPVWFLLISISQFGQNTGYIFVQSYQSICDISRVRHSNDAKAHSYNPLVAVHCRKNVHSSYIPQYSTSSASNDEISSTLNKKPENKKTTESRDTTYTDANTKKKKNEVDCNDRIEEFMDLPALEIIEFEGILNFRSALPGTGLPIYRCAALDNATASDSKRLLTGGLLSPLLTSTPPSTLPNVESELRCLQWSSSSSSAFLLQPTAIRLHHIMSYRFTSYPVISYYIVSYHNHIISYHNHVILYHIISKSCYILYHIISCYVLYPLPFSSIISFILYSYLNIFLFSFFLLEFHLFLFLLVLIASLLFSFFQLEFHLFLLVLIASLLFFSFFSFPVALLFLLNFILYSLIHLFYSYPSSNFLYISHKKLYLRSYFCLFILLFFSLFFFLYILQQRQY